MRGVGAFDSMVNNIMEKPFQKFAGRGGGHNTQRGLERLMRAIDKVKPETPRRKAGKTEG